MTPMRELIKLVETTQELYDINLQMRKAANAFEGHYSPFWPKNPQYARTYNSGMDQVRAYLHWYRKDIKPEAFEAILNLITMRMEQVSEGSL